MVLVSYSPTRRIGADPGGDPRLHALKCSKPGATDAEIAAKAEEGIARLRRYAADPTVPALAKDTRLHLILFQFKGTDLIRLEEEDVLLDGKSV